MGGFLIQKNGIYMIPFKGIEQCLLTAHDAFVEKREHYWVITDVEQHVPLQKDSHFLIKNGKRVENYCNDCSFRLRALNDGCSSCLFLPLKSKKYTPLDRERLVTALRKNGCYEVDQEIFKNEVELQKMHKKKEPN